MCRRRGGQELGLHDVCDREGELLKRHLDEWRALNVSDPDSIEGNINPSGLLDHFADVLLDCLLIERVHLRRLGHSSGFGDFLGHCFERSQGATGKEDLRSLAGEGAGHRTADGSSRSVDDRVLLLK